MSDSLRQFEATVLARSRQVPVLVELADAPDRLPPAPVRARYLAGAQAVKAGDFAAALAAFIEVLERRRDYDQEGARKAGKAIFQLLGIRHPIVEQYHRAFSSALHA